MTAGFETVVRPVLLPDTRPVPQPVRLPADDKDQVAISGGGGSVVNLSESYQSSISRPSRTETKRQFDKVRVYHKNDDGTVDRDQFFDYEAATKIWFNAGDGTAGFDKYPRVKESDNVEIKEYDNIRESSGTGSGAGPAAPPESSGSGP